MIHFYYFSELNQGTAEVLFEIYDKSKSEAEGSFMGVGIVGIEEILATPSQRQIIPLQPRPYEEEEVSGSLTIEVRIHISHTWF